jgi:hypothetical protein
MKNIWHKYPGQKPEIGRRIVNLQQCEFHNMQFINEDFSFGYKECYWCYESDLIAQMEDVK